MLGNHLLLSGIVILAFLTISSTAQVPADPVVVNIMVDAELSPRHQNMTADEREQVELTALREMLKEIDLRGINTTLYVTGDFITGGTEYRDYLKSESSRPNYELADHSMSTSDKVGGMPYDKQYSLLTRSKALVESAYFKDGIQAEVRGFRPQYFNQSEATYQVLDSTGIVYDSGFKAGMLFASGHKNDTWPYPVEGHSFYAVPVSSHKLDGKLVYLCDYSAKSVNKLSGDQWFGLLNATLNDCAARGDPVVVIFHNFVCGGDEGYMRAYREFLNQSISKKAVFVTTMDLVKIAKTETRSRVQAIQGPAPVNAAFHRNGLQIFTHAAEAMLDCC
jgi:hypothetical protein